METDEGADNQRAGDERDTGATILRFPRDWFGPTEELVPFGPAAAESPADFDREDPPTADAFWSEGAACIHDAMRPGETLSAPGNRRLATRRLRTACAAAVIVITALSLSLRLGGGRPMHGTLLIASHPVRISAAVSHRPEPKPAHSATFALSRARPRAHVRMRAHPHVHAAGLPASTPAVVAAAPQPETQSARPSTSSAGTPAASAASVSQSSQPAYGAAGALGPGSSPNS